MTNGSGGKPREGKGNQIVLGDDFGPAAISVNGITLTIDADGKPTLKTPGDATVITNGNITAYSTDGNIIAYTSGTVQLKAPAPEQTNGITATVTKNTYNIGDVLPDGWVVGPRSPKTGIVMAIEPVSGALDGYKTWHQGEDHAKDLREQGHANARQPSADNDNDELKAIYNEVVKAQRNGNAKLDTSSGSGPCGKYWSGTSNPFYQADARVQFLDDGLRGVGNKDRALARVRCVRDEPGLTLA